MFEATPETTYEDVREYVTQLQGTGTSSLSRELREATGRWLDQWIIAERKRIAKYAIEKIGRKVSRVEVINSIGRIYVNYSAANVEVHLQDDERTLKIFVGE